MNRIGYELISFETEKYMEIHYIVLSAFASVVFSVTKGIKMQVLISGLHMTDWALHGKLGMAHGFCPLPRFVPLFCLFGPSLSSSSVYGRVHFKTVLFISMFTAGNAHLASALIRADWEGGSFRSCPDPVIGTVLNPHHNTECPRGTAL